MTQRQRKLAFGVVVAILAAAVAALSLLGTDRHPDLRPRRTIVFASGEPPDRDAATRPIQAARVVAARFAVAYLARDSGDDTAASEHDLHATTTAGLWETLQVPVRVPPGTRPPLARFERVNGISETASPGAVAATVEYSRARRQRYLRVVLVNEAGAWRASRFSH